MTCRNSIGFLAAWALAAAMMLPTCALGQGMDERWTVTVNGQIANVNPDGSFTVPNISALDNVGSNGLPPNDSLSDVAVRAIGTATIDGLTYYAIGDCFQISRLGENKIVPGSMVITTIPPAFPVSIEVASDIDTLTTIGQTSAFTVTGTFGDGSVSVIDTICGLYSSSNTQIATISNTGLITAKGPGTALITATADGATGSTLVTVSPGDPLTTAVGVVVDESGTPQVGASVSLLGLAGSTLTDENGAFAISGVASLSGDLTGRASIVVDGVQQVGASDPVTPVGGGFTDIGLLVVTNRIHWVSPLSGSWHTASNWEGEFIPGTGNVAIIDVPDADITVTYSTGTTNLAALECSESFTLGAGTLSIDESSFVDKTFTCQNGDASFTGSGDLTVSTAMVWSSGTMSGTGTTTIAAGATWTGFGGTLARPFVNHGTGILTSSSTVFQDGTLTNAAEGLITSASPNGGGATFTNGSGTNAFINEGTFVQALPSNTTIIGVPFTSTGTVNVNQAALELRNTSTLSGSINVAAGATLQFGGFPAPTHTLDASSSLDSDGTVNFQAGTINVLGSYDSTITNVFSVVNFNTGQTITFPTLTLAGVILSGDDDFLVTGSLTWNGGTMSGAGTTTIASGATLNLISGGAILARPFVHHGSGTVDGTTTLQGVTLTNAADGVMTVGSSCCMSFANGSGTNAFINEGTFNQSGAAFATIGVPFTSTGTINVNQSMLFLSNTSTVSSSINVAPGAIMSFGGGATHTLEASSSIDSDGTVDFSSGTINVLGSYDSTITSLTFSPVVNFNTGQTITCPTLTMNGVLSGSDDISVTGSLTWNGGTMSGTGTTTLEAGSINSAPGNAYLQRPLINHGTLTESGGMFFTNGTLTNAVDGVLTSATSLTSIDGINSFINEGVFNVSDTGTTSVSVPFTNNGTANVSQGTLALSNTSTTSGLINVAAGATLAFSSLTHTLEASSSLDSDGTVDFVNGTINVLGSYDSTITSLTFSPVVNFNTGQTITCPTLTMNGVLSGGDAISVTGSLTWTGGTMLGTGITTLEAGSINSAPGNAYLQRLLVNHGTFTESGGMFFTNGTLTNAVDGVLTSATSLTSSGGINSFINEGVFNVSDTGTTSVSVPFTNNGTANVNQGGLTLSNTSTISGSINVAPGATLSFGGTATHTLDASSSLDSDGTVNFESGTTHVLGSYDSPVTSLPFSGVVNFNTGQTITFPILTMSAQFGAALSGGDDFSVTGSLTWSNGTMSGTGTTTLEAGSTTTGPGSGGTVAFQRPVVNHGTFTTSGNKTFTNGTLTNASDGVLTSSPSFGQSWSAGGGTNAFINEGIFNQSGAGVTTVAIPFTNSGTTNIISSGLTLSGAGSVNNGIMAVSTGANLSLFATVTNAQTGELRGTGTLNTVFGTLTQAGTLAPGLSPGLLTVTGNLPNTATALTNIEIGGLMPGTEHDQLSISGVATLDGALNISLINGFQPQLGQTFTIMTYGSFTGAFDAITGLDLGDGLRFDPIVGNSTIVLEVVSSTSLQQPRATHR